MNYRSLRDRSMRGAFAVLLLAAATDPLLASAEEGGGDNIFAGDLGVVVWTLLIFGLVLFILGKYAWGPLLAKLQEREGFIRDALLSAKNERELAEARHLEYEKRLTEARAEATAIVEEGRRDADALRHRIEEEARLESQRMLERAKREIDIARETAIKDLYTLSAGLATDIAARILGRELKAEDHERLINDSIAELKELRGH